MSTARVFRCRRLPHADAKVMIDGYDLVDTDKAAEISMLLDADVRLGTNGEFPSA